MTAPTANGHRPFDLDAAVKAAGAEATGEPFAFTWHGEQYEIPPQTDWAMTTVRALSSGDLNTAMAELLGKDKYDELCESGMTLGQLGQLIDSVGNDAGMGGLPNSSRPARRASTRR